MHATACATEAARRNITVTGKVLCTFSYTSMDESNFYAGLLEIMKPSGGVSQCLSNRHKVGGAILIAAVGSGSSRVAACQREELPESYQQFLNTSFIGPARTINVGAVNYTYHRFGPLDQEKSTGKPLEALKLAQVAP